MSEIGLQDYFEIGNLTYCVDNITRVIDSSEIETVPVQSTSNNKQTPFCVIHCVCSIGSGGP